MKKKICTAAFLAAVMMTLTACSDTTKTGIIQGDRGSGASDSSTGTVPGGANNAGASGDPSSNGETSADSSSSEGGIVDGKLASDKLYTVKSGETLRVSNGETLLINGRLLCNNGGNIVIDKGGSLMVNGEIELSGKLELNGKMALSDGAKVYGEGSMTLVSFDDIDCEGDFTAKIIPPERVVKDGLTTVGGVIICNKKIALPSTFGSGLSTDLQNALQQMRNASGYEMPVISGFRSYEYQKTVFKQWCDKDGEEVASTYSARPGHSEHQTGLAADITSIYQSYGETKEGKWVAAHCHEYGFIIRYPIGKDDITGYMYEPWHLRYLGRSTAKLVHDSGLTLDEFLGVES